jgi:ATP-binding cassette, subfamily C (CFTR/MRP), member 1
MLWLFALLEVYYIKTSRYRDIPWGFLNVTKSLVLFALIALAFIDMSVAIDVRESQGLFPVHIVTPIIKIVSFVSSLFFYYYALQFSNEFFSLQILAAFLMYFNKRSGIQSSGLLFLFWFILFLFAIPQLRTEIGNFNDGTATEDNMSWLDYQFYSYIVYFALLTINFVLNCFADLPPRDTTYYKSTKPSPEVSASFGRKLFFQWFDSMTWNGFRKPLDVNDMWDVNPEDTSRELNPVFDKYWYQSVESNKRYVS